MMVRRIQHVPMHGSAKGTAVANYSYCCCALRAASACMERC
jgi:hypothetical protein